jgi:tryptophan 2,3-dioxygenase
MLARVARIFEQLELGAWDVLRTMTPSDYTGIPRRRSASLPASSPTNTALIEFLPATATMPC